MTTFLKLIVCLTVLLPLATLLFFTFLVNKILAIATFFIFELLIGVEK